MGNVKIYSIDLLLEQLLIIIKHCVIIDLFLFDKILLKPDKSKINL